MSACLLAAAWPCLACRELTIPIAQHLGIPRENVFANRMNWQVRLLVQASSDGPHLIA